MSNPKCYRYAVTLSTNLDSKISDIKFLSSNMLRSWDRGVYFDLAYRVEITKDTSMIQNGRGGYYTILDNRTLREFNPDCLIYLNGYWTEKNRILKDYPMKNWRDILILNGYGLTRNDGYTKG